MTFLFVSRDILVCFVAEAYTAPDKVGAVASQAGTRAHQALDRVVLMTPPERKVFVEKAVVEKQFDVGQCKAVDALSRWQEASNIRVTHQDTVVYSHRYRFAGAMDALGVTSNGTVVALELAVRPITS